MATSAHHPLMATYLIRSIIHANSPTTKWLTCHANGPSRRATSTSTFRARPHCQDSTTTMLHNHHPSPMTATAYHNHNQRTTMGHEFPPPTDGDERPRSSPLESERGGMARPSGTGKTCICAIAQVIGGRDSSREGDGAKWHLSSDQ